MKRREFLAGAVAAAVVPALPLRVFPATTRPFSIGEPAIPVQASLLEIDVAYTACAAALHAEWDAICASFANDLTAILVGDAIDPNCKVQV